ncbi:hypothetical protein E8E11_006998 [Didymella keratinophila]|nr:hypothetical protein E8E11_006998 [Didymella keratinophila]
MSVQVSKSYEELRKAIETFQNTFADILKTDGRSQPLSWASLSSGISRIRLQHEEKTGKGILGKTKGKFHRLCEGINDHASVLKILPQEYAGPVCSSIELIVKASVNHEQMGEDFASALEEVDEIIHATHQGLALYPNHPRLQDLVAQLCLKAGGKRLRTSFNENSSKVYEKPLKRIRTLANFIDQAILLCSMAQSQETHSLVQRQYDALSRYCKELHEERLRSKWQIDEAQYALLQQAVNESNRRIREDPHGRLLLLSKFMMEPPSNVLGQPIKQILVREADQFAAEERDNHAVSAQDVRPNYADASSRVVVAEAGPDNRTVLHTRVEVEAASGGLNAFFDFDKVAPDAPEDDHFAETDVVQRLQEWVASPWSSFLGVFGPFAASSDNAFQLLTSKYVQSAKAANMACVSYFCELPRDSPSPKRVPETIETSALLCALIRQMVLHLPAHLPEYPPIEAQRFESLDGTMKTWDAALRLLSDLIEAAEAPVLLFAVYGLEMLEHDATRTRLVAFVETLRHHVSAIKVDRGTRTIVKILMVTSGNSQVLASTLSNEEICDMDRGDAAMKPGAARRGRMAMYDMEFGS